MMAYEGSESAWGNFGKFIYQLQPKTKTLDCCSEILYSFGMGFVFLLFFIEYILLGGVLGLVIEYV